MLISISIRWLIDRPSLPLSITLFVPSPPQAPSYAVLNLTCFGFRSERCTEERLNDYLLVNPDPPTKLYYK